MSSEKLIEEAYNKIVEKINAKSVSADDFNNFIKVIKETTPESVRDRIRRRVNRNATDTHIDNETGHQSIDLPSFTKRVAPKRKPENQQNHGRSKIGLKHSQRTQARSRLLEYIINNHDSPVTEQTISDIKEIESHRALLSQFLIKDWINKDWLYKVLSMVDND